MPAIPYAIAVLLTVLTVPKRAALVGIVVLAVADPLAAVIGIRYDANEIMRGVTEIICYGTAVVVEEDRAGAR